MPQQVSWAWVTGRGMNTNQPENLEGYEFDSSDTYQDVDFRDGDSDGRVGSTSAPSGHHTNDGVAIDGSTYNVSHHWTYDATFTYFDGETYQSKIMVMRVVDDPDRPGSGPHHGKLIFRLHDNAIDRVFNGPDGEGGVDYYLGDIDTITIDNYVSDVNARSMDNALKEFFPEGASGPTGGEEGDPPDCLTRGVRVKTARGEIPVEDLRSGDRICTLDRGYQTLRLIFSRKFTEAQIADSPEFRPIVIEAHALAPNLPVEDLIVSPQHRIWVSSRIARNVTGSREILVPAKKLLGLPGVRIADSGNGVEYFHLLFEEHELIWCNGAVTESLYTGSHALKALPRECAEEIMAIFPEMLSPGYRPAPARPIVQKNTTVAALVKGHVTHGSAMVTAAGSM